MVVFVCEHGSAKSLIARLFFERAAQDAGLAVRAESCGTAPDEAVPERVKSALGKDGFELGAWRPRALAESDFARASRVIAFDVALPAAFAGVARLERWDGMPAVSEDYAVARDAIRARVEALVRSLMDAQEG